MNNSRDRGLLYPAVPNIQQPVADAGPGPFPASAPVLFNGVTWDRMRNLQSGSLKYALTVAPPLFASLQAGTLYTWDPTGGSGNQVFDAPAGANNVVVRRLRNPPESTKLVTVHRISILANVARQFEVILKAPASPALGTGIITAPRKAGANPPQASGTGSANAGAPLGQPTWGTVTVANTRLDLDMWFQLPPDSSLDLAWNDATTATTDRLYASLDWSEDLI